MSKFFKSTDKKASLKPEAKAPRPTSEIKAEYDQAAYNLGQLEYLVFAKELEASDTKKKLLALNQEFFTASELEKAAAAAAATTAPEATSEQA